MKPFYILLFIIPSFTYASDLTYELKRPDFTKLFDTSCDHFIHQESESFISDITNLLNAHNEQNWPKSISLLDKYTNSSDSELFIKNKNRFLTALLECDRYYAFSNNAKYYYEIRKDTILYLAIANNYTEKQEVCTEDIKPTYDKIINNMEILLSSNKKSANKAVKRD